MRPWKIVLSAAVAAICAAAAILRPDLSAVSSDSVVPLLLPRLPVLALASIAVYALAAVVASAGGLIAAAVDLRRCLDRGDAVGQAAATLDWIAAFDATALRGLVPRPVGALPKSAGRSTTILLSNRFDPQAARTEAAHVFYIWLARTHALGALAALAALGALGFAQQQGGAPFLPGKIPTGSAMLVLAGLLLLVLLARLAIDVTVDPLIEAMSRLPWEQVDAGRLRYAVELLETARIDAVTSGRSLAGIPNEVPERLAVAFEDGNRALAAVGERLSTAAEVLDAATRSSRDALDRILRETRSIARHGGDGSGAGTAALQAAIETLTAELRKGAVAGRGVGSLEEDRRALADAVERLSAAADAVGAAARSSSDTLSAALRETAPSARTATEPGAGAASIEALRAGVEALTAEVQQLTALFGAARGASPAADAAAGRAAADLRRELQQLLAEI
jgi:hypothetical protein